PANLTAATPPATPTVNLTQPTCSVLTGTIVVTAPTGAGFEYSLDGGAYQASATFITVPAGNHSVTVRSTTDNTCISAPTPANLTAATPPATPTVNLTQPTCSVLTGTIVVTAPTGAGFEYSLDGGTYQASATFNTVPAGNHSVTVRSTTDNTCISAPTPANLTAATPPATPTVNLTQPTCSVLTGTIVVTAPTGAGFEYSLDGGTYQASATFNTVPAGNHSVTVRSAADHSCISAPTPANLTAATPPATPTVNLTQPTCSVLTGTIVVTAPTGAGFEYSLDGGAYQASATFNTVPAGNHSVTVRSTTDNTCTAGPTAANLVAATPPATPVVSLTQPTCSVLTGTVVVTAPTGAGFEYSLDGGAYQASATFNTVPEGNHSVTVRSTTDNTCTAGPTAANLVAATPPATPVVSLTQPTCSVLTGTIVVTAPTGAGFEYSLDGGAYQASATFNTVPAGNHSVTVRSTTDNT